MLSKRLYVVLTIITSDKQLEALRWVIRESNSDSVCVGFQSSSLSKLISSPHRDIHELKRIRWHITFTAAAATPAGAQIFNHPWNIHSNFYPSRFNSIPQNSLKGAECITAAEQKKNKAEKNILNASGDWSTLDTESDCCVAIQLKTALSRTWHRIRRSA